MTIIDIILDQMQSRGLQADEDDAKAIYQTILDSIKKPSEEALEAACKAEFNHNLGMATNWDECRKFAEEGHELSKMIRDDHLKRMKLALRAMIKTLKGSIETK